MSVQSAVVLAAGEGKRLRPLTKHRPKPMLPAANRPILEYVLDALIDGGIDDLHLVVGYGADRVQDHFGSTYRGRTVTYHHQEKQLGSGHALLQVRDDLSTDFCVVNGDQLVAAEMVRDVLDAHTVEDVATMAVMESEAAPNYGAVRVEGDRVVEFVEKPRTRDYRLLNAGIYVFSPSFLATVGETPRPAGELALSEPLAATVADDNRVRAVRVSGQWLDATYPWDLLSVTRAVLSSGLVDEPAVGDAGTGDGIGESGAGSDDGRRPAPGGRVYVADSATVHGSAVLRGPVVVGADAVVGPNAVVGPGSAVGRNATVGAGSVVRDSILDADARVEPNATLVDCIAAAGAAVGAGATAPGGTADVIVDGTVHEGVELGGVLADRADLGGGATVAPGTLIGPGARVGTGVVVSGTIREGAEVIS